MSEELKNEQGKSKRKRSKINEKREEKKPKFGKEREKKFLFSLEQILFAQFINRECQMAQGEKQTKMATRRFSKSSLPNQSVDIWPDAGNHRMPACAELLVLSKCYIVPNT